MLKMIFNKNLEKLYILKCIFERKQDEDLWNNRLIYFVDVMFELDDYIDSYYELMWLYNLKLLNKKIKNQKLNDFLNSLPNCYVEDLSYSSPLSHDQFSLIIDPIFKIFKSELNYDGWFLHLNKFKH